MRIDTSNPEYYKHIKLWKDVALGEWNDWRWQAKNSVKTLDALEKVLKLSEDEKKGLKKTIKESKFQVTPYYLSLIDQENSECPIRMQCIPTEKELVKGVSDIYDPLGEDKDSPVPRLVHRYPDRVLFLASEICSTYCRFCTRRRMVLDRNREELTKEYKEVYKYIRKHRQIRDVIVSGGDALMLQVDILEEIIASLRSIPHVEIIRMASRTPCVFPQRVTDEVVNMMKKYQPLFFMTHFNHPYELTPAAACACARIADAGIPIMNQSVLLRKINSSPPIMRKLVHELLKARVRPYYIYQCDLAEGIEHFRTPVGNGLRIMESLRGHTSGIALPTLVFDAPGGGGKVPIMPNYLLTQTEERVIVRNYCGMMSAYAGPEARDCKCSTAAEIKAGMIEESEKGRRYLDLVEGKKVTLEP